MAKFHPDLDMLTEFTAGTLSLAQSACVSMHLSYCTKCQEISEAQTVMAANLFEDLEPVSVSDSQLDIVMSRLDEDAPLTYSKDSYAKEAGTPAILQRLMHGDFSDLNWKKITSSLRISYLSTGDPYYEFALYHIKAGGVIPEHNHQGSEMTLVLEGGFSDSDGTYHAGDFLFREAGDVHSPAALADQDCICLAVLDAPLKFTRLRHRWMNPFLQLKAS